MACEKRDCMYFFSGHGGGSCNYMTLTGQTKLGQIPRGQKYSVENCQFYEKGKQRRYIVDPPMSKANPVEIVTACMKIDSTLAMKLYDLNLCDDDMAMFLNSLPRAVSRWRKQHGLIRPRNVVIKRISWGLIDEMIEKGLSDEEIVKKINYEYLTTNVLKVYRLFTEGKLETNIDDVDDLGEIYDCIDVTD